MQAGRILEYSGADSVKRLTAFAIRSNLKDLRACRRLSGSGRHEREVAYAETGKRAALEAIIRS